MKPKPLSSLYILILPCGIRSPMFSVNRNGGRDHSGIAGDIERNQQIFCVGHFVGHFHPGPRASRTGRGAIGRQDIGPNDVLIIAPYNAQVFGLPPDRGAARSYEKVREQTKIQVTPSVRVARGRHGIDDDRRLPPLKLARSADPYGEGSHSPLQVRLAGYRYSSRRRPQEPGRRETW
jgi:hypothetical protein